VKVLAFNPSFFSSSQTLKQKIRIWLGIIIMLLGSLIILSFYFIERNDRETEIMEKLNQTIALQSLHIERWTQERFMDMKRIATSEQAKQLDLSELMKLFEQYKQINADYGDIFFVNTNGYVVIDDSGTKDIYAGDRDYFQAAQNLQPYISGLLQSKATNEFVITFSAPITNDKNEFQGAIVSTVSLKKLGDLMSGLNFGDTGEVFVLNDKGYTITQSRFSNSFSPNEQMITDIVNRALTDSKAIKPYTSYSGEKVFGQYQWSSGKEWIIVGEITVDEVYHNLYRTLYFTISITVIILFLSFVAVVVLASRIERPVIELLKGTKIIRNGNYAYQIDANKVKKAPVELQQLVETFNLMTSKLQSTIGLLEHSALMDQLTDIHNRRYIMTEGSKLLEATIRSGLPCSVIMLDIDYFKKINDTYGHLIGDRVLKHIASLLRKHQDDGQLIARYGGEEFIIVALNSNAEQSRAYAERLRQSIESEPYVEQRVTVMLSASMGIAENSTNPEFGTTLMEDMVSRADDALYQAKAAGRNLVVVSSRG
jgi:two-component system cell cycle response regulator